jgi:Flp pilus assembly protein CpaB
MNLKLHTFLVQYRRELSALCAGLAALTALNLLRPHPSISVVSAAHNLSAGHVVEAGDLSRINFNIGWPSALTRESDVIGHTLTHAIHSGTPFNSSDLVNNTMTKNLSRGLRAVAIDISASDSMLAQIGSQVDVFSADGAQVSFGSLVLAVNQSSSSGLSLGSSPSMSVIVAMSRSEVSQLARARTSGNLTIAVSGN